MYVVLCHTVPIYRALELHATTHAARGVSNITNDPANRILVQPRAGRGMWLFAACGLHCLQKLKPERARIALAD